MSPPPSPRPSELRALIERFLQERLDAKLEPLAPDDPKRDALRAQYECTAWVDDAARRVGQIQAVTHALKATHPDARGTSVYKPPPELPRHDLIGSHVLGTAFATDVVGNAAALDVHKFLKLAHEGRTLLDLMRDGDADLKAALSDDAAQAAAWIDAFTAITQARSGPPASHALAKQLYWLIGDDPRNDAHYHLLAPLYASSLAHSVHARITEHRFGEPAKAARQARRDDVYSDMVLHDYPGLAVQNLGGTKPQNISQLNSERGGNNYLLASLPPLWVARDATPALRTDTVFTRFGRRRGVKEAVESLRVFLQTDPPANLATREFVKEAVLDLCNELFLFEDEMATLAPGWSAAPDCRLHDAERFWLDRRRADTDEAFAAGSAASDWAHTISERFANWLNGRLDDRLPLGDPEFTHWRNLLEEEFESRQREGLYD